MVSLVWLSFLYHLISYHVPRNWWRSKSFFTVIFVVHARERWITKANWINRCIFCDLWRMQKYKAHFDRTSLYIHTHAPKADRKCQNDWVWKYEVVSKWNNFSHRLVGKKRRQTPSFCSTPMTWFLTKSLVSFFKISVHWQEKSSPVTDQITCSQGFLCQRLWFETMCILINIRKFLFVANLERERERERSPHDKQVRKKCRWTTNVW